MTFETLPSWRALAEWHWLRSYLLPAVEHDPERSIDDVRAEIATGHLSVHVVNTDDASGIIVTSTGRDFGRPALWVNFVVGRVEGGPHRRVGVMKALLRDVEDIAVAAGCRTIVAEGRNWGRVLTGYGKISLPGGRFEFRKAF